MSDHHKSNPALFEEPVSSREVYSGRLLHVFEDHAKLSNGNTVTREYIKHPGAVVAVPITLDAEVVLVRQFRYPLHREFIELPAGKIDPGEELLVTGQRELLEETGYTANRWTRLATIHPAIGYSDEHITLFLAEDLELKTATPDEDELLEVLLLPLDEALQWVCRGRITDPKTMLGLLWADKIRRGEWTPAAI